MGCVGQFPPSDELDVLFLEKLAEFLAGEKIKIALAPGRAVVGMVHSYCLQLGIVMTEVDDHFGKAGFQVLHCVDIEVAPFVCVHGWIGDDHRIQSDVLIGEDGEKLGGSVGNPDGQKRQLVFMRDFDVNGKKFRGGEEHTHVTVQMCGLNSESHSALDLGTDLALSFLGFYIAGRGKRFGPQIAGGIEEA